MKRQGTTKDAALVFNTTTATIRRWVANDLIPFGRNPNNRLVFDVGKLIDMANGNGMEPGIPDWYVEEHSQKEIEDD